MLWCKWCRSRYEKAPYLCVVQLVSAAREAIVEELQDDRRVEAASVCVRQASGTRLYVRD